MKELYETWRENFGVIYKNVDKIAVNNFDKISENFYETLGKNLNNFRKILRILKAIRKLCINYERTFKKFWTDNVDNIFDKIS